MTNQEIIAVVQAAERGEQIERQPKGYAVWVNHEKAGWDFVRNDYRVKPAPLEGWVNVYPNHICGDLHESKEIADKHAHSSRIRCAHVREVEE